MTAGGKLIRQAQNWRSAAMFAYDIVLNYVVIRRGNLEACDACDKSKYREAALAAARKACTGPLQHDSKVGLIKKQHRNKALIKCFSASLEGEVKCTVKRISSVIATLNVAVNMPHHLAQLGVTSMASSLLNIISSA